MSITDIYPVWSTVINYLSEANKIKLRSLDSTTNDIVNNSFNLNEVLGRWRYANKQLSHLFNKRKQQINFHNEQKINQLSNRFLLYWGVNCDFVIIDENVYLLVESVLGNKNYYFVSLEKEIQKREGLSCNFLSWIHSNNTFNIEHLDQSNNLIFHFYEASIKFHFNKQFLLDFEILKHNENQNLIDYQDTNHKFIRCSVCSELKGITRKFQNSELIQKLDEIEKTYSYFRLNYSMSDSYYLLVIEKGKCRSKFEFLMCSDDTLIKQFCFPFETPSYGEMSTAIMSPWFFRISWCYQSEALLFIVNLKTGQIVKFEGIEGITKLNWRCHFFEDLCVGFAFDTQDNELQILNQSGKIKYHLFSHPISKIAICNSTYSMIVLTKTQFYNIELLSFVKTF